VKHRTKGTATGRKTEMVNPHPACAPTVDKLAVWIDWDARRHRWRFHCTFDTQAFARQAKFRWDPECREWVTEDPQIVAQAAKYLNASGRAALFAAIVGTTTAKCPHGTPRDPRSRAYRVCSRHCPSNR